MIQKLYIYTFTKSSASACQCCIATHTHTHTHTHTAILKYYLYTKNCRLRILYTYIEIGVEHHAHAVMMITTQNAHTTSLAVPFLIVLASKALASLIEFDFFASFCFCLQHLHPNCPKYTSNSNRFS